MSEAKYTLGQPKTDTFHESNQIITDRWHRLEEVRRKKEQDRQRAKK